MRAHWLELKVPPLLLALVLALLMWLSDRLLPGWAVTVPARAGLAMGLGGLAGALLLAGVLAFRRAQTSVDPIHPERSAVLVTSGVYRYSRNPMYVAFLLLLAAWGLWLSNIAVFALLPLFVIYMNRFQIGPEERALQARFGAAFTDYKQRTRRWW